MMTITKLYTDEALEVEKNSDYVSGLGLTADDAKLIHGNSTKVSSRRLERGKAHGQRLRIGLYKPSWLQVIDAVSFCLPRVLLM